jgi:hypothetical protein
MNRRKTDFKKYQRLLLWSMVIALLSLCVGGIIVARLTRWPGTVTKETQSPTALFALPRACGGGYTAPIQPTPTAVASATPTPLDPNITPTPTPLFTDRFFDQNSGWPSGDADGYIRVLDGNGLILCDTNHHILTESLPTETTFSNFALSVSFTLVKADKNDSMGIYLRGDSNLYHDYRIDLYGDGHITVNKEFLDNQKEEQTIPLATAIGVSALAPIGQRNNLVVTMDGALLALKINGTPVLTVADLDYEQGQMALFVNNGKTSDGVMARFHHIEVQALPPTNVD